MKLRYLSDNNNNLLFHRLHLVAGLGKSSRTSFVSSVPALLGHRRLKFPLRISLSLTQTAEHSPNSVVVTRSNRLTSTRARQLSTWLTNPTTSTSPTTPVPRRRRRRLLPGGNSPAGAPLATATRPRLPSPPATPPSRPPPAAPSDRSCRGGTPPP